MRLGAARGVVDIPLEKINELIVNMQPATISAAADGAIGPAARDAARAKAVRGALA